MPEQLFAPPRGRIELLTVESDALRGNLLGDPPARSVAVYLPEGYDRSDADYPLFVLLAGYHNSGVRHTCWQLFGPSLPQRVDRLVQDGKMGPVVLALPDCCTSLGGNQYVDSVALGGWATFLVQDMLPRLEQRYRVRCGRDHRAVFGKSSGGYGAVVHGMRHAEHWGAVACHSGDMNFDIAYRRDFPQMLELLARHDHDIPQFLEAMRAAPKLRGDQKHAMMLLAMAATYDPDPALPYGIRLPLDPHTAELDEERWRRWLAHDPLQLIDEPGCRENLRSLSGLYIDCGRRDQFHLHYGARAFVRKLTAASIEHRYEEFDDDHNGVDYRMDVSLPFLYEAVGCR